MLKSAPNSPIINSRSRLANTAPFNSKRGIEILCLGAILLLDIIRVDHHFPVSSFHLMYAVAPNAKTDPSEKITSSRGPTVLSCGQRLRENSSDSKVYSSAKNSNILFRKSSGRGSSHRSVLHSPSHVALSKIFAFSRIGDNRPIGSNNDCI